MGMEDALAVHWHVDRDTMMRRQAEGSDRTAAASSAFKFVRLVMQSAMIGVGAVLLAVGMLRERRPVAGFGARLADLR